jgi:hypothetical protein
MVEGACSISAWCSRWVVRWASPSASSGHGLPLRSGVSFMVSGECVWLLAYPLVVPNTPRKILIASLLAASMGPAGLAISAFTTGTPITTLSGSLALIHSGR